MSIVHRVLRRSDEEPEPSSRQPTPAPPATPAGSPAPDLPHQKRIQVAERKLREGIQRLQQEAADLKARLALAQEESADRQRQLDELRDRADLREKALLTKMAALEDRMTDLAADLEHERQRAITTEGFGEVPAAPAEGGGSLLAQAKARQ